MANDTIIREATENDSDLLWEFLAIAAYEPSANAARPVPVVAAHLSGWKRPSDFGFVAVSQGLPVGAAWARQFNPKDQPSFYFGARYPEVSIGVRPDARHRGIGASILDWLGQAAIQRDCAGLCLNVRDENPAIRLYERAGFRKIPGLEIANRTGGVSIGMVLEFGQNETEA